MSAVAVKLGYTDIIPTECGCPQMIQKLKNMGAWDERDNRVPSPLLNAEQMCSQGTVELVSSSVELVSPVGKNHCPLSNKFAHFSLSKCSTKSSGYQ